MKGIIFLGIHFVLQSFTSILFTQNVARTSSGNSCESGKIFMNQYQFEKAINAYSDCYGSDSMNGEYLSNIAHCYFRLGQLRSAEVIYLKLLGLEPNHVAALNQLANIYSRESNAEKSLDYYNILLALDSSNSYYHWKMAEIFEEMDDIVHAKKSYESALTLNPENSDIIVALCRIYQDLKYVRQADSLIRHGRNLYPTNVKLILAEARSAYDKKDYASVIKSAKEILGITHDTSAQIGRLLGLSLFHTGQYEEAIFILNYLVSKGYGSEIVHYILGLCYRKSNIFEKSIEHFNQAIEEGVSDNISVYYTNLASVYEGEGMAGESIKAYQEAYKASREKILLYQLARNYDNFYKDKKTAIIYYEKYLATNDTDNAEYIDFSSQRLLELKQIRHFGADTLD